MNVKELIASFGIFFIITHVISQEMGSVSVQLKFGDRIGKLKRNYKAVSITTTKAPDKVNVVPSESDYFIKNEIHRSDDYLTTSDDEHSNQQYFILKQYGENKTTRSTALNISLPARNATFQSQNEPSSLVQARLEMLTDFFDVPSLPSVATPRTAIVPKTGVVIAAKNYVYPTNYTFRHVEKKTGLRQDKWVFPVLAFAVICMLLMGSFEVFVLCKTHQTSPNRRHLFLGQMLLLGLFCAVALSAFLTAFPTNFSCAVLRFGAGVSFAIIFASMLVKCIFLISLNGGVYLPAIYQGLLLLFAVLIQITINFQWLLNHPAGVTFVKEMSQTNRLIFTAADNFTSIQICKTSFSQLRISLVYIDFLIITVAILAIKSREIRDNYREAFYIGLSIALVVLFTFKILTTMTNMLAELNQMIPVWLGFTLVGLAVHEKHKDACLAFGLLVTPMIVFFVMFMPKGRQLAAMGREDIYLEDREERFSASSRAGSGYSPSFFHFKPIKYGVMSGKSSGSKQQQATTIGDDYAMSYYSPHLKHSLYHHLPYSKCIEQTPTYYFLQPYTQNTHKLPGIFFQDEAYATLEQTQQSSNPNVYFQRTIQHPW